MIASARANNVGFPRRPRWMHLKLVQLTFRVIYATGIGRVQFVANRVRFFGCSELYLFTFRVVVMAIVDF